MSEWTDERIDKVYGAGTIGAKWVRDLRDEVESLKAALRSEHAQPASGEWRPIEARILIQLGVEVSSIEAHRIGDWDLPADMAVCRLTR